MDYTTEATSLSYIVLELGLYVASIILILCLAKAALAWASRMDELAMNQRVSTASYWHQCRENIHGNWRHGRYAPDDTTLEFFEIHKDAIQ